MRKRLSGVFVAVAMLFAVACGKPTEAPKAFGEVDFAYEEEDYSRYGVDMVFGKPTVWNEYAENVGLFPIENGKDMGLTIAVLPPKVLADLEAVLESETVTDEQKAAAHQKVADQLVFVGSFVITDSPDRLEELKTAMAYENGVVVETQESGRSLLYLWSKSDLSQVHEDDVEMMEAVLAPADQLMKVARFAAAPGEAKEEVKGHAGLEGMTGWMFTAKNVEGREVTEAILGEHPLTLVNVWGTFCGPCRQEMPQLAKLHEAYGDRIGFLGIVGDVTEVDVELQETAKTILAESGVKYENILLNPQLQNDLLNDVVGFPTTFFVNSEGDIVGDIIVGARDYETFAAHIEGLLQE